MGHFKNHPITEHTGSTDGTLVGTEGGVVVEKPFAEAAAPSSIPIRDSTGRLTVLMFPSNPDEAASKQYVDSATAGLAPATTTSSGIVELAEHTEAAASKVVQSDDPRLPTQDENNALLGTQGTPTNSNRFVTDADPRIPTLDENNALVGTNGTPGVGNPYVTDSDPRLVSGANTPTSDEKAALAGTSGTPSNVNRYVTDADPRLPTTGENDALQGASGGGSPSNANRYVLQNDAWRVYQEIGYRARLSADVASAYGDGLNRLVFAGAPYSYAPGGGAPTVSVVNGAITFNANGKYLIQAHIQLSAAASGGYELRSPATGPFTPGTGVCGGSGGTGAQISLTTILAATAGQTFDIVENSGATAPDMANLNRTHITIVRISGTNA